MIQWEQALGVHPVPDTAPETFRAPPVTGGPLANEANEVALASRPRESFRAGLVASRTNHAIPEWSFRPTSWPRGREGAGGWVTHQWSIIWSIVPAQWNLCSYPSMMGSIELPGCERSACREGGAPQHHRDRSSCTRVPSGHHPMHFSVWLFIHIVYDIL